MPYQPDPPDPVGSGPTWQPADLPPDLRPADRPVPGPVPDEARYGPASYGQPPFDQPPFGQPTHDQPAFGQPPARIGANAPPRAAVFVPRESDQTFLTTWLLALLLGTLGIDRFYLGKTTSGVLKLVTGGGCGIWALIDLILVLAGRTTDADGRPLAGYEAHKKVAWIITGALAVLSLAESVFLGAPGRFFAIYPR